MQTKFWVAGFPLAFTGLPEGKKRENIFPWLNNLGIDALELQMTYGPRSKKETCELYRRLSLEFQIQLSVHSAYYIVLTSDEKDKIRQSIDTLKKTFELSKILWAKWIVLHPWPLYKQDESEIKKTILRKYLYVHEWDRKNWYFSLHRNRMKGRTALIGGGYSRYFLAGRLSTSVYRFLTCACSYAMNPLWSTKYRCTWRSAYLIFRE